jgi:Flp pilus assembly protein TadB
VVASLDSRGRGVLLITATPGVVVLLVLAMTLALGRAGIVSVVLGLLALLYFEHGLLTNETDLFQLGLVGVAILIVGELAQWSIDSRVPGRYERGLHRSRAAAIGALALLGLATVMVSGIAAGIPIGGGIESVVIAMAASVGVLGLISLVGMRSAGTATGSPGRDPS